MKTASSKTKQKIQSAMYISLQSFLMVKLSLNSNFIYYINTFSLCTHSSCLKIYTFFPIHIYIKLLHLHLLRDQVVEPSYSFVPWYNILPSHEYSTKKEKKITFNFKYFMLVTLFTLLSVVSVGFRK